jgi:hypothetical protein
MTTAEMTGPSDHIRAVLRRPEVALGLSLAEWDLLVRQARRAGLLARIAYALDGADLTRQVPEKPRQHLEAERVLAEKHARDVRWEVRCIAEALQPLGLPVILLKGGAYALSGLPPARGRVFSDIDILVPKERIDEVEEALKARGWYTAGHDAWDQRFYRRWMHQIPPLTHFERGATIDVHHTIVPETARIALPAAALRQRVKPVLDAPGIFVLDPADMVLHSATHLFNEGEFDRGLRDLIDLDLLLRHFGGEAAFWTALVARAAELDLKRPLFYCLRYTRRLLETPVPEATVAAVTRFGPPAPQRRLMDFLFLHALRPAHQSCRDAWSGLALWPLYVRAHHLRMPAHLLLPHLVRKAVMRRLEKLGFDAKPARVLPQR